MDSNDIINNHIEMDERTEFRWIIGNIFFTSMVVLLAFVQMYIYYNSGIKKMTLCFSTFFITLFGLLIITRNIPMSILTAIITANVIVNCGNVNEMDAVVNETVVNETVVNETVVNETVGNETAGNETVGNETVGNETVGNEILPTKKDGEKEEKEPLAEVEQKKIKQNYLTAGKFKPYLTGKNNKMAYPKGPAILKFQ